MNRKKIIATTGYARAGKNSLADYIKSEIEFNFPDRKVELFSFAYFLRLELREFILNNLELDVFTENEEEKKIVRPFLIAYGNAKRYSSKNQYWIQRLDKKISESDCDVAIITDLRFAETNDDELGWLRDKKGVNIYIERTKNKRREKAPNEFEAKNGPILKKDADHVLVLERVEQVEDFYSNLKKEVDNLFQKKLELFV